MRVSTSWLKNLEFFMERLNVEILWDSKVIRLGIYLWNYHKLTEIFIQKFTSDPIRRRQNLAHSRLL